MAHFAKLEIIDPLISEVPTVSRVIVVDNNDILDAQGIESEALGIQFCEDLLGGTWLQTSYNRNFRKNYANIGDIYDTTREAFISPQQYPSWVLSEDTCLWEAPVAYPEDGKRYEWNEGTVSWDDID
jgi:hypothetical protein